MDLKDKTEEVFRFAIDQGKIKPDEIQIGYARHVAHVLEQERDSEGCSAIGLLEAETGVGKTLGYLIPLLLKQYYTGEKVAVSTHTTALQDQIYKSGGDMDLALDIIRSGLCVSYKPRVAVRKGLKNFVSTEKILKLCEFSRNSRGKLSQDMQNLLDWAKSTPTGEIREFYELYGDLPEGLTMRQITLEPADSEKIKRQYRQSAEIAKYADVLIVNHAVALSHSMSRFQVLDGEKPISHLIFDEANRVPDAARMIESNNLSLFSLKKVLQAINKEVKTVRKGLQRVEDIMQEWIGIGKKENIQFKYINGSFAKEVTDNLKQLKNTLSRTLPMDETKYNSQRERELIVDVKERLETLDQFIAQIQGAKKSQVPIMRWSPTKQFPSVDLVALYPGAALKPYWSAMSESAYLKTITLTSATLGSGPTEGTMAQPFGIVKDRDNLVVCERFEPRHFGSLEFVLPDSYCPQVKEKSNDEEVQVRINSEWYDYAGDMIEEARRSGGRTLVLTASYTDVEEFAKRVQGAILHTKGQQLKHLVQQFKSNPDAVLITPAGWEGLDLPGLIKHLVIPRIPYSPPDDIQRKVVYEQNVSWRNISASKAKGLDYSMDIMHAVNKMKQGIGRAIRKHDDSATVWIADPRFPWPASKMKNLQVSIPRIKKNSVMLQSIPSRFREEDMDGSAWERARIFTSSLKCCG